MTKRWTALIAALVVCLALPVFAQTDEPEMDPLLELLVEQGVITAEQAKAVEVEYARREAAKAAEETLPREIMKWPTGRSCIAVPTQRLCRWRKQRARRIAGRRSGGTRA